MKGNTILWIVLSIVGAAIAYVLLKGRGFNILPTVTPPVTTTPEPAGLPTTDVEAIMSALSLSNTERSDLRSWIRHIKRAAQANENGWSQQGLAAGAEREGISYDQHLVLAALYQYYKTANKITANRYTQLYNIIVSV